MIFTIRISKWGNVRGAVDFFYIHVYVEITRFGYIHKKKSSLLKQNGHVARLNKRMHNVSI